MLVIFLFAIDSTIVSTSMPTIVAKLGGLELYSWVFSIYMLTSALTTHVEARNAPPGSLVVQSQPNGAAVTRLATTPWPTNNFGPAYSPDGSQIAFSSDRRHPDLCCEELFVMRAGGSHQHLVDTGIQGVIGAAWGTAPPVPAGSPGTLSRLPAGAPVPGTARYAVGCRDMPACGAPTAPASWHGWPR